VQTDVHGEGRYLGNRRLLRHADNASARAGARVRACLAPSQAKQTASDLQHAMNRTLIGTPRPPNDLPPTAGCAQSWGR
jgi:hypothetical protein